MTIKRGVPFGGGSIRMIIWVPYHFSFLKFRFRNPSRPPFSKGGELFSPLSQKDPIFSPFEKGDQGGFNGFSKC
jgi:hypothetical protein